MKKLNLYSRFRNSSLTSFIRLSLLFVFLITFSACKSIPAGNEVSAIELLDNESSFYIAIPQAVDYDLIVRVIQNNVSLSQSDAKLLADRISKVYCGLNKTKNHTEIQVALDGSIPQKYIASSLKPKNGWTVEKYSPEKSLNVYPLYTYDTMTFAFPSESVACLGRDVKKMVDTYDKLFTMLPSEVIENMSGDETFTDSNDSSSLSSSSSLSPQLYNFLDSAKDEIRFCANKPQSFLTLLTGAQLDLKLIDVYGSFVPDPNFDTQYLLNFTFNFKNETYMKAGKTLLTLAFGLTNAQSLVVGQNTLQINGIKIDKKQLYKLLVI